MPAVVAGFQDRIRAAKGEAAPKPSNSRAPSSRRLDPNEMARVHYTQAVAFDTDARDKDYRYAAIGFLDGDHVGALRAVVAGRADHDAIIRTIGPALEYFRRRGNHAHAIGSPEWRSLARAIAQVELAALAVTATRDEGEVDPPIPA